LPEFVRFGFQKMLISQKLTGIDFGFLFEARFCEENFEGRRGIGRNGNAGVETYVKLSIASDNDVFTKIIPQNFRKITSYREH
jgi:hypothetical protein